MDVVHSSAIRASRPNTSGNAAPRRTLIDEDPCVFMSYFILCVRVKCFCSKVLSYNISIAKYTNPEMNEGSTLFN
jgi:hypothetical protein